MLKDKDAARLGSKQAYRYMLRLFVSGMLPNSVRAIKNLNSICEQHLKDNYDLKVIDINQRPEQAITEQIVAVPILIIKYPFPERRLTGDLSNTNRVLEVLNIK